MKIRLRTIQGNVLFGTLVITGILCIYLGSYLTLVRNENLLTSRSQTWNIAIPVAEAGIEEALTRLRWNTNIVTDGNGWGLVKGYYLKTNILSEDEKYVVGIFSGVGTNGPVIVSEGFVRPSGRTDFISRTIEVKTSGKPFFGNGMVADLSVDLHGGALMIDSFDSTNPAYSTGGLYDPAKRRDNGSIACNSSLVDTLNIGNAKIYGKIGTGPGGKPKIGSNGRVGDIVFVDESKNSNNGKIQKGHWTDDINVEVEPVQWPGSTALPLTKNVTPIAVNGTNYDFILNALSATTTTDYQIDNPQSFTGAVIVQGTGTVRLWVKSDIFAFGGLNDRIKIEPGASLEVYVESPNATINGNNIQNDSGRAGKFTYFGLPSNTSLKFAGGGGFIGAIYAPNAVFEIKGGGDFYGACVTKTITMDGSYALHYDESLAKGPTIGYVASWWDERKVTWNSILAKNLTADSLY